MLRYQRYQERTLWLSQSMGKRIHLDEAFDDILSELDEFVL